MPQPLLSISNLTLRHAGASRPVLENFSLDVFKGEVIAILGPSGVGKSSLLHAIAGLDRPPSGGIVYRGTALKRVHPKIVLGFQDAVLLPWLTVEKNVGFGLGFRSGRRLPRPDRKRLVDDALKRVGLFHARLSMPRMLSGGMAQRVALARSIAREPEILLLDEPFGALDEVTRRDMQDLLLRVVRDLGTTAMFVTHDIAEALQIADRVLLLGGAPASILRDWSRAADAPFPASVRVDVVAAMEGSIASMRAHHV